MSAKNTRAIQRIAIAGNGLEAWLAAAFLARRLDGKQTEITVCPVTGSADWDGLYTQLPSFPGDPVRELGFSDLALAQLADASFSLGTRYRPEGEEARRIMKPHGPVGVDYSGVGFHQYWRRTSAQADADDYFRFSPGAIAMKRDALAPPVAENAIGPLQHEMVRHVDPWALQKHLRQRAFDLGVREARSDLQRVSTGADGQRLAGLVTRRDETLEADLYLDCSGPHRALVTALGAPDWRPAPLSRAYLMQVEHRYREAAPRPYATLDAQADGWRLDLPRGSEDIEMTLHPEGEGLPFQAGQLDRPWQGNCLAMGNAAASLLPTDPLQARFFMNSLERLLRLLPGRDCRPGETTEYNQLFHQDAEEAHGLGALFEASRQFGSVPAAIEQAALPEGLADRIRLFARRGWVGPRDSQLVPDHAWRSACILLGVIPDQYDRLADRIPFEQVQENLRQLKLRVSQVAHTFPRYDDYFAAVRNAAAQRGKPS